MRHFIIGLLKLLFFFFLFLSLLEIGLRIAGYAYIAKMPIIYEAENRTRALGAPPPYTILCIGDSFTFGGSLKAHNTYPYQLWRLFYLKGKNESVRVVNKGHCEHNSKQVLRELKKNLEEFNPQIVILLVGSSNRFNIVGSDFFSGKALSVGQDRANIIVASHPLGKMIGKANIEYSRPADNSNALCFLRDFFLNLRVYKMLRSIILNLERDTMLRRISYSDLDRLMSLKKDKVVSEDGVKRLGEMYFYKNQHELCLELALKMIESCPQNSKYYSSNPFYYYLLVWALGFQDKYDAQYVLAYLDRILAKRPEFWKNNTFLKYYRFFQDKERASGYINQKTKEDIEQIAYICKERNIRLVIQSYPCCYTTVNKMLEEVATQDNLSFVDNYKIFSELVKKNGKETYFMHDMHCTPEGYRIMAENIYGVIGKER